jgi:hypothetical protein
MRQLSPRAAAYGLACLVAAALAGDVLWMPIQVTDSLGELLDAQQSASAWTAFTSSFGTEAYLRPLRIAQIKALFDAAQGEYYWLVYRGFHALLVVAATLLFVRAIRVTTWADAAAAAFALAVFTGLHTFRGNVQEAFPINHFLEIAVFCLLALNLARSRGGWWADAAAVSVLAAAVLTLESGVLVWVVAAAAWMAGWRGVSARGLALMTACLCAYLYVRFGYLSTGVPALAERSSGYLLSVLDPPELERRFGQRPFLFYGYNVGASVMSVLFSEPQAGVFAAVRAWVDDRVMPRVVIPVASSLATTAVIVWAASGRMRRGRPLDDIGRFILLGAAVVTANAVLSFAYTKDDVMSTAGVFYALAAFAGMRAALAAAPRRRMAAAALPVFLCLLACGWAIRAAGLHYVLRSQAIKHQVDWVELPGRWQRSGQWPHDAAQAALIVQLRREAVYLPIPNTRIDQPEWPARLWSE